jgi:hypothetical protein
MSDLSPAANAVLDAYMDNCGWLDGPMQKDYQCVAAVLRAVVNQVVPDQQEPASSPHMGNFISHAQWHQCQVIRTQLLAIATEFEVIDEEDDFVITAEFKIQ